MLFSATRSITTLSEGGKGETSIVNWDFCQHLFPWLWLLKIQVLFSSITILSFSANISSTFSKNILFVRNGLIIDFEKSWLVWTPVFVKLLRYTLIAFRRRDTHLFLYFLYIALLTLVEFLLYLFFHLLLAYISFLGSLVITEAWLPLNPSHPVHFRKFY